MKIFLFISVLIFQVLFSLAQSGVTVIDSIISEGLNRKFRLYIPNSYTNTSATPLVLNLHGYGSNALQQQPYSNLMAVADTANFLIVHPDGTGPVNGQYWNSGFTPSPDDILFLKNLIDSISINYNVDADRMYSCGMSNGGIMSYYLACYLPNKIAAIASVTGSMLNSWFTCAPVRPFPVMEIHGTADVTVPYNGDGTFVNIDSVIKKWRIHNNCNPVPVTYSVPDINLGDNSTAVNYKYLNGNSGTSVELYKVNNGSHSWPGAAPIFANTNQDFNASVEIWRFFRQYKLNQFLTGINNFNYDSNKIKVFPNPSTDLILVDGIKGADLTVFSLEGKKIISALNSNILNVKSLDDGLYFLEIKKGNINYTVKIIKN